MVKRLKIYLWYLDMDDLYINPLSISSIIGSFQDKSIFQQKSISLFGPSFTPILTENIYKFFKVVTTVDECDFIFFIGLAQKNSESFVDQVNSLVDSVDVKNKPCVVFYPNDNGHTRNFNSKLLIFRRSLFKSCLKKNDYSFPAFPHIDWIPNSLNYEVTLRDKLELPVVGFCGSFTHSLRRKCVHLLKNSDLVNTNLIERSHFYGRSESSSFRTDFYENIIESDFGLCIRGVGNYSYRLYELLSCGRVPIIIDTDMVLPYKVDISKFSIYVDAKDVSELDIIISNFWNNISNDDFQALQLSCRKLWINYFSIISAPERMYLLLKHR